MANNQHGVAKLRTAEERDVRYGLFYQDVDESDGWEFYTAYPSINSAVIGLNEHISSDNNSGEEYRYKIQEMPEEVFK